MTIVMITEVFNQTTSFNTSLSYGDKAAEFLCDSMYGGC